MSENSGKSSSKSKNGKANASEKLIQLSKVELDNLVQRLVANAIEPLEAEIKALKAEVSSLRESQEFISDQNDDLTKSCKSALLSSKQQKQDINRLNKCTEVLQK